ncbi:MAG: hypothetical protein QM498_01850 [Desulfobacterium sp.]
MTLSDQINTDMPVFFNADEFSVLASFNAGDPISVTVDHDVLMQAQGYDTGVGTMGTVITAMVSDLGAPSKGDTFVIGDTTYTVQRIGERSEDNLTVQVVVK